VLSTQQERSFKRIDPSDCCLKRGKVDKHGESMVASYKVPGGIQSRLTNFWEQ